VNLLFFLFQVFVISLSGVLAPGPVTAAAVSMGSRSKYAGTLIGIGHAIIEFPLMVLIMLGMDTLLKSASTQIVASLAGGGLLLVMAIQMLANLKTAAVLSGKAPKARPILTGLILSVSNPYFLLWWASVGLALATRATQLGIWAFALFAVVHWLCDCAWLQALSWTSFKGSNLLSTRGKQIVLVICSLALFLFGLFFIYTALGLLFKSS